MDTEYGAPEAPVIGHNELQHERTLARLTNWVEPREKTSRPMGFEVFSFDRFAIVQGGQNV